VFLFDKKVFLLHQLKILTMTFQCVIFWMGLFNTVLSSEQALQITGTTAYLDGNTYWIPQDTVGSLQSNFSTPLFEANTRVTGSFVAITVLSAELDDYSETSLEQDFSRFRTSDDVWSEGFANGMVS
jgi:hypothetical protein